MCSQTLFNLSQSSEPTNESTHASNILKNDSMKVNYSSVALVKIIRTALKVWQTMVKYTTKPLLSQGVEGDMAMAKNCRRVFNVPAMKEERAHIAFEDKMKLIAQSKVMLMLSAPRVQVVPLANWEAAPTFVLDEHLWNSFPKVSTDRLLNKCNPFLSGKGRAHSDDDIVSEAPTVSTDCSVITESDVEGRRKSNIVEEEVKKKMVSLTLKKKAGGKKAKKIFLRSNDPNVTGIQIHKSAVDASRNKQSSRWVCVGYGRYVKQHSVEQTQRNVISAKSAE